MTKSLIVYGQHIEELEFGLLLAEHLKTKDLPEMNFYKVEKSAHRLREDNFQENKISQKEIFKVMKEQQSAITIDVHTGDGMNYIHRGEIWTFTEYEKLKSLDKKVNDSYLIGKESLHVIKLKKDTSPFKPLVFTKSLPYVALEIFNDFKIHKPPYKEQVEFAANIVQKIISFY